MELSRHPVPDRCSSSRGSHPAASGNGSVRFSPPWGASAVALTRAPRHGLWDRPGHRVVEDAARVAETGLPARPGCCSRADFSMATGLPENGLSSVPAPGHQPTFTGPVCSGTSTTNFANACPTAIRHRPRLAAGMASICEWPAMPLTSTPRRPTGWKAPGHFSATRTASKSALWKTRRHRGRVPNAPSRQHGRPTWPEAPAHRRGGAHQLGFTVQP